MGVVVPGLTAAPHLTVEAIEMRDEHERYRVHIHWRSLNQARFQIAGRNLLAFKAAQHFVVACCPGQDLQQVIRLV